MAAEQAAVAASPAVTTDSAHAALTADPTVGAGDAGTAGSARRPGPACAAGPTVTEQKRATAVTTGLPHRARTAVAAIAEQPATSPTSLPSTRRPVGAVAEQRAPRQVLHR